MKVTGGCHCGQITYEAEVDPAAMRICHCTDCQKLTGTAFRANIASLPGTFRLVNGTPKTYLKTAESGNKRAHGFCPECGTPIYATSPEPNPPSYGLRVGGIDQRAQFAVPVRQIWCRSALPWSLDLTRRHPHRDAVRTPAVIALAYLLRCVVIPAHAGTRGPAIREADKWVPLGGIAETLLDFRPKP